MTKKITIVTDEFGDWEGLYVCNKLVLENHNLLVKDVLECLQVEFSSKECDGEWLGNRGTLPEYIEEVKFREDSDE